MSCVEIDNIKSLRNKIGKTTYIWVFKKTGAMNGEKMLKYKGSVGTS